MRKNILILFFLAIQISFAQQKAELKVEGRGELLKTEFIGNDSRDINGNVCAGIKIVTDLNGLAYTSNNQIVKIKQLPGQALLFVSPGERAVQVFSQGYKPLNIILADYGIFPESGQVWKLEITGEKIPGEIPVTILREPSDAVVFVDGIAKGEGTVFQINPGRRIIRIEKEHFDLLRDTIEVDMENVFFEYKLREHQLSPVKIATRPENADLNFDNRITRKTNSSFWDYPGRYFIEIKKENYLTVRDTVEVFEGTENVFSYELKRSTGFLDLNIATPGVVVSLNGRTVSEGLTELEAGNYEVILEKPGVKSFAEKIEITRGGTLKRNYKLSNSSGFITIYPEPEECEVKINNISYKRTTLIELNPGRYQLRAEMDDYFPFVENLELAAGENINLAISLKPKLGGLRFTINIPEAENILIRKGKEYARWKGIKFFESIPAGEYKLISALDGYKTVQRKIIVEAGEITKENIELFRGSDFVDVRFNLKEAASLIIEGEKKNPGPDHIVTIPSGKRNIAIFDNSGNELYNEIIEIEADNLPEFNLLRKDRSTHYLASALVPGLGQALEGRYTKAGLIFGATAAALGLYISSKIEYDNSKSEIDELLSRYNESTVPELRARYIRDINSNYDNMQSCHNLSRGVLVVMAGVYLWNIVDIFFLTEDDYYIDVSNPSFKLGFKNYRLNSGEEHIRIDFNIRL